MELQAEAVAYPAVNALEQVDEDTASHSLAIGKSVWYSRRLVRY
jgi:hypothetical protein